MRFIAQQVHQILNAGNRSARLVRWSIPINGNEYFGFGVHEKFMASYKGNFVSNRVQNYIALLRFSQAFTKIIVPKQEKYFNFDACRPLPSKPYTYSTAFALAGD
jgi:hypothetical protein